MTTPETPEPAELDHHWEAVKDHLRDLGFSNEDEIRQVVEDAKQAILEEQTYRGQAPTTAADTGQPVEFRISGDANGVEFDADDEGVS